MAAPKTKIEFRALADLELDPENARKHSDGQLREIANLILEFGWTMPAMVDDVIRAGNGRAEAAALIYAEGGRIHMAPGPKAEKPGEAIPDGTIPCLDCTGWSPKMRKAYALADNRVPLNADWDEDRLSAQLAELRDDDFDLNLLGFGDETDALLALVDKTPEVEVVPDPPTNPVSVDGDVWLLGDHRLACVDCTKKESLKLITGGVKVDMVFTDPPYCVEYEGRGKNDLGTIANDSMSDEDFDKFISDVFAAYKNVMKPLAPIYVCHPDGKSAPKIIFETRFAECFQRSSTIIWIKQSAGMGWQDYRAQHEPILYGWKHGKGSHYYCGKRDKTTVWEIGRDSQASYVHPTQKPVALPEEAIRNSSKRGWIVADFFSGSASTLMAAEASGRKAVACDIDPKYVDVGVKRWQAFASKDAIHEATGKTFDQISRDRTK